jgi:hypothetical protein
MDMLTTRYSQSLVGVLSCYDRIVNAGTLPGACFADGITGLLYSCGIRVFDYPQLALPLRKLVRENAQALATEQGATIERIAKAHIRKEDVVVKVLAARGDAPACGLGDGILCDVPAVERQGQRPHFPAAPHNQMPALLLLLNGPRVGADLCARAHLLSVSTADALQRSQLAGAAPEPPGHMLGFKSFRYAATLIAGIEIVHMIKEHLLDGFKDQATSAADRFYSLAIFARSTRRAVPGQMLLSR